MSLKTIASICIIWMMAYAQGKVACNTPEQTRALQPGEAFAAPAPTPVRTAINCLDPNDMEARRPKVDIKGGVITNKALELPQPVYPPRFKPSYVKGTVAVEVVVDGLSGKVIWARPMNGHPLLRLLTAQAACRARFSPSNIGGTPFRVSGIVIYPFPPVKKARPAASRQRTPARRARP